VKSLIRFILSADSSQLEDAARRGGAALENTGKSAKESAAAIGKWGGAAAAAAIGGLTILVAKSMETIDAQAKFAQSLHTTSASMATLERAGQLAGIGMDKIRAGAKKLDVVMGQAAAGAQAQSGIFKRLGVDMADVASQPLDKRILTINAAIAQNIPLMERAAISAQIFGEEAGSSFARLDADTMRTAAEQAELFGLALSDVDAAKVEQANDSFSTISMAFKGIITQLTVQMAPVLKAIGDLFLSTAAEGGGMGKQVEGAFGKIIKAAGFVMNAADGIKRVFTITVDVIIAAISALVANIASKIAGVLETVDSVASAVGINVMKGPAEAVRKFATESQGVVKEAMANIDATLNKELAGDAFLKLVDKAKAAGQAAAEAAVSGRAAATGAVAGTGSAATKDTSAADAKAKAEADAIAKRLESLKWSFATEQELIQKKHADELALLQEGLAAKQITTDQAYDLEIQSFLAKEAALSEIERSEQEKRTAFAKLAEDKKKSILSSAMNALTGLMNSGSRKLFEIGKAASISQAVVATWTGATEALKLGFPLGPPAAAAILAGGFANVASIRAQSFGGGGGGAAAASSNTGAINAANMPVGGGGAQAQQQQRTNVTFVGDTFGGAQLVTMLNQLKIDGYTFTGA